MPKSNLTTAYKLHLSADARDRINYLLATTDCRTLHELIESLLAREEAIVRNMHAVLTDQTRKKNAASEIFRDHVTSAYEESKEQFGDLYKKLGET